MGEQFILHPSIRIAHLKQQLAATDYKTLKYAEGLISESDYAPIKAQRQALREQINALEEEIASDSQ